MAGRKVILVVEDEADLAEVLRYNLEREGYACRVTADGDAALAEVKRQTPSAVILDRMLPGTPGDEVATQLKRDPRTAHVPIIMLTAKAEESDELVGFALGADDYVSKPFSMKLLLARVASALRRAVAADQPSDVHSAGPITLDHARHELIVDGQPVSVTATEFRILQALVSSRGRVLNRAQLIDMALGHEVAVTDRTIDVHITALRKKLGPAASWIQTIRGVGYTCRHPV